jgi:hypothetical protein
VGFWDGSTLAMRFGFFGFCGAVGSLLVRLLAMYLSSNWLAYVSVGMMIASLGVGIWGLLFLKHG